MSLYPSTYRIYSIINSIVALSCSSVKPALPPRGGIAPLPLMADCTKPSISALASRRLFQASLSPFLGDSRIPVP